MRSRAWRSIRQRCALASGCKQLTHLGAGLSTADNELLPDLLGSLPRLLHLHLSLHEEDETVRAEQCLPKEDSAPKAAPLRWLCLHHVGTGPQLARFSFPALTKAAFKGGRIAGEALLSAMPALSTLELTGVWVTAVSLRRQLLACSQSLQEVHFYRCP
jgi:hypothetical protein